LIQSFCLSFGVDKLTHKIAYLNESEEFLGYIYIYIYIWGCGGGEQKAPVDWGDNCLGKVPYGVL